MNRLNLENIFKTILHLKTFEDLEKTLASCQNMLSPCWCEPCTLKANVNVPERVCQLEWGLPEANKDHPGFAF